MKHSMLRSLGAWFALVMCTAAPVLAGGPPEGARALFAQGEEAYREARYEDAIRLFLRTYEIDPKPTLLFDAAQAYERLGDVPNALRWYREYLRQSPQADDRSTVEEKARNLAHRLSLMGLQQVTVLSTPPSAKVVLDGQPIGKTPWTGEITPGPHMVVLVLEGFPDTAKQFVLASDRAMSLDLDLRKAGQSVASSPSPEQPVASSPSPGQPGAGQAPKVDAGGRRSVQPLTWVALGVGAAGLAGTLGFELARRSAEDDARNDPTQVGYAESYDTMHSRQTTARVLLAVSGAAAVTGGVLLYLDLRTPPTDEATAGTRLGVGCGGTACAVSATGTF